jgi:Leucine-rich repeat (LRR) protein
MLKLTPEKIIFDYSKKLINKDLTITYLITLIEEINDDYDRIKSINLLKYLKFKDLRILKILENCIISESNHLVRNTALKTVHDIYREDSSEILDWSIENEKSPIVVKSLYKILHKNSRFLKYQIMFNILLERLSKIYKVDGTEVRFYLDIQALRNKLEIKNPLAFQQWQIREDKEIGLRRWSITDSVEDVIHHGAFCTIKKNHTIALNLYSNNLKLLPSSIGSLFELKYLYLQENKLNTLPESTGDLSKLKVLDLSYNCIEKLPDSLFKLQNLAKIRLYGGKNQLKA